MNPKQSNEKNPEKMLSIKTKLLGTILPLTIIIVLVLTGISYFISKSIISSYSENLLSSSIENQSNEIEAWLNENLSSFQVAKKTIEHQMKYSIVFSEVSLVFLLNTRTASLPE